MQESSSAGSVGNLASAPLPVPLALSLEARLLAPSGAQLALTKNPTCGRLRRNAQNDRTRALRQACLDLGEVREAGHRAEALIEVRKGSLDIILGGINAPVAAGLKFLKTLPNITESRPERTQSAVMSVLTMAFPAVLGLIATSGSHPLNASTGFKERKE
jgi:hypothetical protein